MSSTRKNLGRRLTLVGASVAIVAFHLAVGVIQAQTLPPSPEYTYDVVSIHRSSPDAGREIIGPGAQGGLRMQNVTALAMLTFAYDVRDYQVVGAPGWASSDHFDVNFTPDKTELALGAGSTASELSSVMSRQKQRTQAVLRDRFGVTVRAETRELPMYVLIVAKGGHKLSPPTVENHGVFLQSTRTQITASGPGATLKMLVDQLAIRLGRPVSNETGLDGLFDFKLEWTPDTPTSPVADGGANAAGGPSIFTALTEQLGLRLESRKGPVPVYLIERIEKPSEN